MIDNIIVSSDKVIRNLRDFEPLFEIWPLVHTKLMLKSGTRHCVSFRMYKSVCISIRDISVYEINHYQSLKVVEKLF